MNNSYPSPIRILMIFLFLSALVCSPVEAVPGIEKGFIYWDGYKNDAAVNSTEFFTVGNTNYFLVGGMLPTSFIKVLSYNLSTRQFKLEHEIKAQGDLTSAPQRIESLATLEVGDSMPTIFFVSRSIVGTSNKGVFAARFTGGQYVPKKLPGSEKTGVTFLSVYAFSAGGTNYAVATCDVSPDKTLAMLWSISKDSYTLVDSLSGGPATLYLPPVGGTSLLLGKPVLLPATGNGSEPTLFARTGAGMTATAIKGGKFGASRILPTPAGVELTNIVSFVDNSTVKGFVTSRQGSLYSWQTGETSLTKLQDNIASMTSIDFGDFSGDGKIDLIGGLFGIAGKMLVMTGNGSTFSNLADNLGVPGDNSKDPQFVKLAEGPIGFFMTVKSPDGVMNQVALGVLGPETQPLMAVPVVGPNLIPIPGASIKVPLDFNSERFRRTVKWNSRVLTIQEEGEFMVRIFSTGGREYFSHSSKGISEFPLSPSSLGSPGVYLVIVCTAREAYSGKIIVPAALY